MTSIASTSSETSPTVTPEQIAEATTLKQLQALLQSVDPSGFEHTTKKQALTALIRHSNEQAKAAGIVARSSETAPCSPLPTSPASSPRTLPSLEHNTQRLTPQPSVTEPNRWEEHHRKLKELDKRLDELDRRSRQLYLIVYSLPEDQEDPLREILHMIDEKHRLEMCVDGPPQRLGRCWPDTTKPRLVRLKFGTMHGKHLFLKNAKVLRQAGFRVDDDLTPLQQRERGLLEEDAETLRTKGYHPFYRGSQLHHFHIGKMHTCRKGKASNLRSADEDQLISKFNKACDANTAKLKELCDSTLRKYQAAVVLKGP